MKKHNIRHTLAIGLSIAFLCAPAITSAALTSSQVSAIVNLLQVFGADQSVITNVQSVLSGGSNTTAPSSGATTVSSASSISVSTKFSINESVQTTTSVNIHYSAGVNFAVSGTQPQGSTGVVVGGPVSNDGYTWWNVSYTSGASGWTAENYLAQAATPTPTTSTQTPTLSSLSTYSVPAGSQITVYGSNFDQSSYVQIDGRVGYIAYPTQITSGSFMVAIPSNVPAGSHVIQVCSGNVNLPCSQPPTTFTVTAPTTTTPTTPTISYVTPSSGSGGETITVYGNNFPSNPSIDFWQNNKIIANIISVGSAITSVSPTKIIFTLDTRIVANSTPGNYQLSVENPNAPGGIDSNQVPFTFLAPTATSGASISIIPSDTMPVAGAQWAQGSTQSIYWSSQGLNGAPVNIILQSASVPGATFSTIASNQPSTGSYSWAIPTSLQGNYLIVISSNNGVMSKSYPLSITIPAPAVIPTATLNITPTSVTAGQPVTYNWSSTNATSWSWTLNILKSNDLSHTVSSDGCGIPGGTWAGPAGGNSAKGSLTLPTAACQAGYTYNIMYTANVGPSYNNIQSASAVATITVTAPPTTPTITVSSPASGTQWAQGTSQTIQWSSQGLNGSLVNIYLQSASVPGVNMFAIATNQPSAGSYSWTIPPTLQGNYFVVINSNNGVTGQSSLALINPAAPTCSWSASETNIKVGDTVTYSVTSSPQGLYSYYNGTVNGTPFTPFATTPAQTNFSTSIPYHTGDIANYVMYVTMKDASGNIVCTTNTLNLTVSGQVSQAGTANSLASAFSALQSAIQAVLNPFRQTVAR